MKNCPRTPLSLLISTLLLAPSVYAAGESGTVGNTKLGVNAGAGITTGDHNTFIGHDAAPVMDTGNDNTAIGFNAGLALDSASDSTFVGAQAGEATTTAYDNTFIGARAGQANTTSTDNTFIGAEAGIVNTKGNDNTFVGEQAGFRNTEGDYNTFIGEDAGYENTLGKDNTALGRGALKSNVEGKYNTAIGSDAGWDMGSSSSVSRGGGTANRNTAVGNAAGYDIGSGNANTMIGDNAGPNTEYAHFNTFVGFQAGFDNNRTNNTDQANRNTALGAYAGYTNREGEDNVWIGALADSGKWNFKQDEEVAYLRAGGIQWDPQYDTSTISGGDNTISRTTVVGTNASAGENDSVTIGYGARSDQTFSVAIGSTSNATGKQDIAIGATANSKHQEAVTIGYGAVSHGDYIVTLGNENTLSWDPAADGSAQLGSNKECGEDPKTYDFRCVPGYRFKDVVSQSFTAVALEDAALEIDLWADDGVDANDQWSLNIADGGAFSIASYATSRFTDYYQRRTKVDVMTLDNTGNMTLNGGLTLNSDERLKQEIQPIENALEKVQQIEAATYYWKPELQRDSTKQYGLIAQNVEAVIPELVRTGDDDIKSVNYQAMIPVLIKAMQEQQSQIAELTAQIQQLQSSAK